MTRPKKAWRRIHTRLGIFSLAKACAKVPTRAVAVIDGAIKLLLYFQRYR